MLQSTLELTNTTVNTDIYKTVSDIAAFDDLEREHIQGTLEWISSGAQIFRIQKPDIPNKHLVSYFVLFDPDVSKVLLVDHKKSGLWLPSGGHVEPGEHPKTAAERECYEELQIYPDFMYEHPIFITSTLTTGLTAIHTDVSLWYVVRGSHKQEYAYDPEEFNGIQWFGFDQIPYQKSDPHMKRFIEKLQKYIGAAP